MLICCVLDGHGARAPTRGRRARAGVRVRGPTAGPEAAATCGPAVGAPGQPAVLGLVLGAAAGDALAEDRRHGARLLGHDGVPEGVGQQQAHGPLLGPCPGLLGHLPGLRDG